MANISGIGAPTSSVDSTTKSYVDAVTKGYMGSPPSYLFGKSRPEIHDPHFSEIEQIMREVGVKFYQVVPEIDSSYFTAYCVSAKHHMWININSAKQFLICVERLNRVLIPLGDPLTKQPEDTVKRFDICEPDFLEKLAKLMRKTKVLSLTKYWFIKFKLWRNKK